MSMFARLVFSSTVGTSGTDTFDSLEVEERFNTMIIMPLCHLPFTKQLGGLPFKES
jgi:hypothetical protein